MGQLDSWLQTLRDVCRFQRSELDSITDTQKRFDRLEEQNVREQCINIINIDHVQRVWDQSGYPKIHGWVFDVKMGKLIDLKLHMEEEFKELRCIYNLKPLDK